MTEPTYREKRTKHEPERFVPENFMERRHVKRTPPAARTQPTKTKNADAQKRQSTKGKKAAGPKYGQLIMDAITLFKERRGSSRAAIRKYVEAHLKGSEFKAHMLRAALSRGAESGKLAQTGQRFRIGAKGKKEMKEAIQC